MIPNSSLTFGESEVEKDELAWLALVDKFFNEVRPKAGRLKSLQSAKPQIQAEWWDIKSRHAFIVPTAVVSALDAATGKIEAVVTLDLSTITGNL